MEIPNSWPSSKASPSWKRADLVGQRAQHVPAEAARRHDVGLSHVVDASTTTASSCGSTTSNSVAPGMADRISGCRPRRPPAAGRRRCRNRDPRRCRRRPTSVRSTARFSSLAATRSSTDWAPYCTVIVARDIGHVTSRKLPCEITPGGTPVNHGRSDNPKVGNRCVGREWPRSWVTPGYGGRGPISCTDQAEQSYADGARLSAPSAHRRRTGARRL